MKTIKDAEENRPKRPEALAVSVQSYLICKDTFLMEQTKRDPVDPEHVAELWFNEMMEENPGMRFEQVEWMENVVYTAHQHADNIITHNKAKEAARRATCTASVNPSLLFEYIDILILNILSSLLQQ